VQTAAIFVTWQLIFTERSFCCSLSPVLLVSAGVEKRIGGARFPQCKQPGKELETFKVMFMKNNPHSEIPIVIS
jgi:hypothetical protein